MNAPAAPAAAAAVAPEAGFGILKQKFRKSDECRRMPSGLAYSANVSISIK
jgi:hypothetical protein